MSIRLLSLFLLLLFISGCAVTEIAQDQYVAMKNFTIGEYYLQYQKYREGIVTFQEEIARNPTDAKAHYYLGRCYLAEEQPNQALEALKRAVQLDPGQADSHFWLGVAYAVTDNREAERKSYQTALAVDPDHVPALVYLGHNYFEVQDYRQALAYYNRALKIAPDEPQALYNRGLIYREYERTPEEIVAWRIFLENYPQGAHSRQAADFLKTHGVFDYRNHLVGIRTITLNKMQFEPLTADIAKPSRETLDFLGKVFEKQTRFDLHVIAYQKNNKALAKARAQSVKAYLLKRYRTIHPNRIKISWFDVPEKIVVGEKRFDEDEIIQFFCMKTKR